MHKIDLSGYNFRSDLVADVDINSKYEYSLNNIHVSFMKLGRNNKYKKKEGYYLTIDFNEIIDGDYKRQITNVFSNEFKKMLKKIDFNKKHKVCVIGLGNRKATPDSLGPKVIDEIIVTKHLFDNKINVDRKMCNVSSFSPGTT